MDEEMEKKIRKVVKEYMERTLKICRTLHGCTSDKNIDCPNCETYRGIVCERESTPWPYWRRCSNCDFAFPQELTPPYPGELKELFELKKKEEKRNKIIILMEELGVEF